MPIASLLPAFLEAESRTSSPDLTRYVMVCVSMVLLVIALSFGFRKLLAKNLKRRAAARSLQVVDMLPLGGKQRLVVVRCYDRQFLIGVGDKELSSIAELDASSDELPESSVFDLPTSASPIHQRGFAGALEGVLSKWKSPKVAAQPQAATPSERQPTPPRVKPAPARAPQAQPQPQARRAAQTSPKREAEGTQWNREEGILG